MLKHVCTDTHNKILQLWDGVMIVVPSTCLTKTLTQQLVVYGFALDNRMCSSIRPLITQCQNQKLGLSPAKPLPPPPSWEGCVCESDNSLGGEMEG